MVKILDATVKIIDGKGHVTILHKDQINLDSIQLKTHPTEETITTTASDSGTTLEVTIEEPKIETKKPKRERKPRKKRSV